MIRRHPVWIRRLRCMNICATWLIHVGYMNEDIYDWDISHLWMRHVTSMNETSLTHEYMCGMTRSCWIYECVVCQIYGTWHQIHTYVCDMSHSYVWHDSFICASWLVYMCNMTRSYVRHDSFICAAWLIRMCDMTHSYVRHDSFICATWLISMCDMTHSYVRHCSIICATCHMSNIWRTTHAYIQHDTYPPRPKCNNVCAANSFMLNIWMYVRHDSFMLNIWMCPRRVSDIQHAISDTFIYVPHDMSHKHEWVVCWMYECVVCDLGYMNEVLDIWRSRVSSCVAYMNVVICWKYEWVVCRFGYMNGSCGTYEWVVCQIYDLWRTWLISMCDMTHMPVACLTHDSFIDLTPHVHKMRSLTCDMPQIWYMCQIASDLSMSRVSDIESGVRLYKACHMSVHGFSSWISAAFISMQTHDID